MFKENWFPHTSQQIVSALRMGGYASFIPSVIEPVWVDSTAPLAGFPISICFTGLRPNDSQNAEAYAVSSYWLNPQTYMENAEYQMIAYLSRYLKSPYRVVIRRSKVNGIWEGCKMRGDEIAVTAGNSELTAS